MYKQQSLLLIKALLAPETFDRFTSVMVGLPFVGFATSAMESLCAGVSLTREC